MLKPCSPKETDTSSLPYLVFEVRGSRYAVQACAVREIVRLPELTPIEETPDYAVGVVNLRGTILPVLDLSVRFGHLPQRFRLEDSVVVVECEGRSAGLIVNQVHALSVISIAEVECVPTVGPDEARTTRFIAGLVSCADHVLMLLDLQRVLSLPGISEYSAAEETLIASACPPASSIDVTPEERSVLQERARDLARPLAAQEIAGGTPLAVVRMSDELFGIDLHLMREFAQLRGVTPVPCCPPHILGLMSLRGEVFTLVDLGVVLGLSSRNSGQNVAVLELGGLIVGVPVQEVLEVHYLQAESLAPAPAATSAANADYLLGTAAFGERMLSLLDVPRVFAQERLTVNEEP